jgi:hypothetical protein
LPCGGRGPATARARNEALFREVNERIVDLETGYDRDDSLLIGFVCECPQEDCSEMLEVTRGQYEAVRDILGAFWSCRGTRTATSRTSWSGTRSTSSSRRAARPARSRSSRILAPSPS